MVQIKKELSLKESFSWCFSPCTSLSSRMQNDNDDILDLQFQMEEFIAAYEEGEKSDDLCLLKALYDLLCNKLITRDQMNQMGLDHYEAFEKVFSMVEDSGWQLASEDEDGHSTQQTISSISDEIMQPPIQSTGKLSI